MRRLTSRAALAVAAAGLATGLAACGGGSSSSSTTTTTGGTATTGGAATATLTIKNFAFQPTSMTVKAGTTITVKNADSATHTVTADNNTFDTGNINGGGTKTLTAPSSPGSFPYHCTIHPFMHGTLTVTS